MCRKNGIHGTLSYRSLGTIILLMNDYNKNIIKNKPALVLLCLLCICFLPSRGQQYFGNEKLEFVRSIPLKNITGKITGASIDLSKQVLYIAISDYNFDGMNFSSIEIIDLNKGSLLRSINSINDPQQICYIPKNDEIFVSTSGRKCYFYSTKDFKKTATIKLTASVNTIYYDSAEQKIYAGYGEDELAIINTDSQKQTGFMLLPAQAESIQLDKSINRLYAFMPESRQTAVIDLSKFSMLNNWQNDELLINQMVVDTVKHRLFLCSNKKPAIYIIDGITGVKTSLQIDLKSPENVFYDTQSQSLYITGKEAINIFRESADGFKQIANIQVPVGVKATLFIPQLKLLVMNREEGHKQKAKLFLYKIIN